MPDPKSDFESNLPQKISNDPDSASDIGAIFVFKITGEGGGTWTVNCKDEPGVSEGEHEDADCTLELTAEDWAAISENPMSAMSLYMGGKLKISGDPMKATKLQQLLG